MCVCVCVCVCVQAISDNDEVLYFMSNGTSATFYLSSLCVQSCCQHNLQRNMGVCAEICWKMLCPDPERCNSGYLPVNTIRQTLFEVRPPTSLGEMIIIVSSRASMFLKRIHCVHYFFYFFLFLLSGFHLFTIPGCFRTVFW